MKKMAKTPRIAERDNIPMSDTEISAIEQETGKNFPPAYREFLLLGGRGANMLTELNAALLSPDGQTTYWRDDQRRCREAMAEENFSLQKDFWVFGFLDSEQFHFFHFDEGDDPPVYWYCSYHIDDKGEDYAGIIDLKRSFSEHINEQIDVAKKYAR